MLQRYPVGIQDFPEIRKGCFVYVDKTQYALKLVSQGKYYFLSRPRRFGKSLFISTLECLFEGKKDLFRGLFIEDQWDWNVTNPVIRMSFSNIGHNELGLSKAIDKRLDEIAAFYNITLSDTSISQKFKQLIHDLAIARGKVVVLIDEYDKPIIDFIEKDTQKALENRDIMKSFYSILKDADPHLKLVFITGVSKFSRVSIFSDLNNLNDITIDYNFSACCGITENELALCFQGELKNVDKDKLKEWYNGYKWDEMTSVYNPFSLLNFFTKTRFHNYWFESGTPTFLMNVAKKSKLYDFDEIIIGSSALSAYDIENLEIIPLMFQTGYLTIKSYNDFAGIYTLAYPNKEVKQSYLDSLMTAFSHAEKGYAAVHVDQIRQDLEIGDLNKVQSTLNTIFQSLPYDLWQKDNEHFYHAIVHLTFSLLGVFVQSEVHTANGRMDALVQLKDYIYCFEFKLDGSADKALQQIIDKGYLIPFEIDSRHKVAVGVNFSSKDKCVEEMRWEFISPILR